MSETCAGCKALAIRVAALERGLHLIADAVRDVGSNTDGRLQRLGNDLDELVRPRHDTDTPPEV